MQNSFGVTIDWRGATIDAITAIGKRADQYGYGYLWIPEAWGLEAFSTIGHLLGVTERIKIGTGVVNVYSRSPATIAMGCATLNQLAHGRFLLGIGASGRALVEGWHGAKFEKPLLRTREYVEAIRTILKGEVAKLNGEVLKLGGFRIFATSTNNDMEIYIGAIGKQNLALAGKIANGAIVALYPFSKLDECANLVNLGGGNRKVFAYLPTRVANTQNERDLARSELSRYVAFYIASMGRYYKQNISNLGFESQVKQIIDVASSSGSRKASEAVTDEFLEEFCLFGSADEIVEKVSKLSEMIYPVFGMSARSFQEAEVSSAWLGEIARSTIK